MRAPISIRRLKNLARVVSFVSGAVLLPVALALIVYALAHPDALDVSAWVVLVVLCSFGVRMIMRAVGEERARHCPRCGSELGADLCPRCGYSPERARWAAIGKMKIQ